MPTRPENRKKRIRREDVARVAGVSSATVSYVLNGTKRLSSEVEQRVLAAARELNYMPDLVARSLAGSRSGTIALLTTDIANVYQLEVIRGLQSEALKHDYVVIVLDAFGNAERYVEQLIARRVDGLFISTGPDFLSDDLLGKLRDADIKVLADFSRMTFLPEISYIMSDHYDGMLQAVRHLTGLGHTKIGYLSAFDESCIYDVRLEAFREAVGKFFDEPPRVVLGEWPYSSTEELGEGLMMQMLERYPEVTAVIATNDLMAIGAIKAIRSTGKSVPEDYSVIGIDNIARSATNRPPLTTIDQDGRAFGAKIFHILKDSITNNITSRNIVPMRLIVRGSTGICAGKDPKDLPAAEERFEERFEERAE